MYVHRYGGWRFCGRFGNPDGWRPLGHPTSAKKSCPKDNDDKDNGRHVSGLRNLFFGNDDKDKNDKDKNDKDKNGHDNCGKGDDSRSFSRY